MASVKEMDAGLRKALEAAGGRSQLAESIGITRRAIYKWGKVPAERVIAIAEVTGVPAHELRPDLYDGYRRIRVVR